MAYVDNIALIVFVKHLRDAELYSYEAIGAVKARLENADLVLGKN